MDYAVATNEIVVIASVMHYWHSICIHLRGTQKRL